MPQHKDKAMDSIVTNLKEICRRKGLSLTDVANRMGTSPSNLLSSVKGNPTISKLEDIAQALGISVAELLTTRPEASQGLVIIGGETYAISKPAAATVQIPTYDRYDVLRGEVRMFIAKSVKEGKTATKMGILETLEFFTLTYFAPADAFLLSLCYGASKQVAFAYDKLEYCTDDEYRTAAEAKWDVQQVTEEILNDLSDYVPTHVYPASEPAKSKRKVKTDFDFNPDQILKEAKDLYSDDNNQEE